MCIVGKLRNCCDKTALLLGIRHDQCFEIICSKDGNANPVLLARMKQASAQAHAAGVQQQHAAERNKTATGVQHAAERSKTGTKIENASGGGPRGVDSRKE